MHRQVARSSLWWSGTRLGSGARCAARRLGAAFITMLDALFVDSVLDAARAGDPRALATEALRQGLLYLAAMDTVLWIPPMAPGARLSAHRRCSTRIACPQSRHILSAQLSA